MKRISIVMGVLLVAAVQINGGRTLAQTATETPCPDSQFTDWGAYGVVTPGDANNLRAEPSAGAALVGKVQPGVPFMVHYRDAVCADGFLWRKISTVALTGWTVERKLDGGEPFIVPYEAPEPREVGTVLEDGTIVVEDSGISFTVPAAFDVTTVTVVPEVGLFGDVMSAQPSSLVFRLYAEGDAPVAKIAVYPFAVNEGVFAYWEYDAVETILEERPALPEYAAGHRMPQAPIGGVAALFGGAPAYVAFQSGDGLRYLTYFAQTSVLFKANYTFTYMYRGVSADRNFYIAGEAAVRVPADSIPAPVSRDDATYDRYLRQFEANLNAQATGAFTPDLALMDSIFASLTVVDPEALLSVLR